MLNHMLNRICIMLIHTNRVQAYTSYLPNRNTAFLLMEAFLNAIKSIYRFFDKIMGIGYYAIYSIHLNIYAPKHTYT